MFRKEKATATPALAPPQSSTEWRRELSRLEGELTHAREKIKAESGRRPQLAIAAADGDQDADKEFSRSFGVEIQLQHELEKLVALVAHAGRRIAETEAAERDAAERERLQKLEDVWNSQREIAARADALMQQFAKEAKLLEDGYATIQNLGGLGPRKLSTAFALAAKHFGLREILGLSIVGKGRSLSDQLSNSARAAGQDAEAA